MVWALDPKGIAYVDRGFGWLKAGRRGRSLVTQSLVVPGTTLPGVSPDRLMMQYRGTTYLVGRTALQQAALETQADLADDATIAEDSHLLYLAALAHAAGAPGSYHCRVVAGLPVDTWETQQEALKALLLGIRAEPVQLTVGSDTYQTLLTVDDAMVMPQGLGALLDLLLDDTGSLDHMVQLPTEIDGRRIWNAADLAAERICVLDVGFNTLNVYALDAMEPIRRYCGSRKLGMAYAYRMIGQAAGGRNEFEIQDLVRRSEISGHEAAFAALGQQITRLVRGWNDPHFAVYLVTGGGAHLVGDYILPGERNKILASNAQEANGRGYLKAGAQRWLRTDA